MKRIFSFLSVTLMALLLIGSASVNAKEKDINPFGEPQLMRVTCYCDSGVTASGKWTRPGVVAAKKEWIGYTVCIYDLDYRLIGIYEVLDTGFGIDIDGDGVGSIQNGTSIDVYQPTLEDCYEWIDTYGDYLYVQIFKGEG